MFGRNVPKFKCALLVIIILALVARTIIYGIIIVARGSLE